MLLLRQTSGDNIIPLKAVHVNSTFIPSLSLIRWIRHMRHTRWLIFNVNRTWKKKHELEQTKNVIVFNKQPSVLYGSTVT